MSECLICYEQIIETTTYCITNCNHSFCINCMNTLMSYNGNFLIHETKQTNCPYCRNMINNIEYFNIKKCNKSNKKHLRIMSDNLCSLLGEQNGSMMNFFDIYCNIYDYIRQNNLCDKESKHVILDEKLTAILHPSINIKTQPLTMSNISIYTKHNYSSPRI